MAHETGSWVRKCTECGREFARAGDVPCEACGARRARGRAWVDFDGTGDDAQRARVRAALDAEFHDLQRDGHVEISLALESDGVWLVELARTYPEPEPTPGTTDTGLDARARVVEALTHAGIKAK